MGSVGDRETRGPPDEGDSQFGQRRPGLVVVVVEAAGSTAESIPPARRLRDPRAEGVDAEQHVRIDGIRRTVETRMKNRNLKLHNNINTRIIVLGITYPSILKVFEKEK